ncbi:MAG: hypothetical protein HC917_00405 [Richelia sp. SM2_1_7]|nr:hypothetical protein [Richelia sp. SM2_1_7]
MRPEGALTVFGVSVALSSALFLGQSDRPFTLVAVRFCPQTINNGQKYVKSYQDSQAELNSKFCRYEHKLLKEVWDSKQFESSLPIPETSIKLRTIPAINSNIGWFLVAPVSFGLAYLSWAKKSERDEFASHFELENFKTQVKLTGVSVRNERDFKGTSINSSWDSQRVANGFLSVDAVQDRLRRQTELQDKTHELALKQFATAQSQEDKLTSENQRDKHKADKESHEIRALVNQTQSAIQQTEKKAELLQTLKNYEGGWLHDMVIGRMPIVIYGKQGAYKSYTAACLALLKAYFQDAKLVSICDPHAHQNQDESWRYLIPMEPEVYGAHEDWEEYAQGINDAFDRWSDRTLKDSPIISIWDELTTMGVKLPGLAPELMPKIISAPRKANDNTICITHSLTNAGLGGVAGMSEAIKEGTLRLKLKANALQQPLFKGVLSGWVDGEGSEIDELPVTLPEWFRDAEIYQLIKD